MTITPAARCRNCFVHLGTVWSEAPMTTGLHEQFAMQ